VLVWEKYGYGAVFLFESPFDVQGFPGAVFLVLGENQRVFARIPRRSYIFKFPMGFLIIAVILDLRSNLSHRSQRHLSIDTWISNAAVQPCICGT
jgi:hypothetical protein